VAPNTPNIFFLFFLEALGGGSATPKGHRGGSATPKPAMGWLSHPSSFFFFFLSFFKKNLKFFLFYFLIFFYIMTHVYSQELTHVQPLDFERKNEQSY
jgi:hypothetical protein